MPSPNRQAPSTAASTVLASLAQPRATGKAVPRVSVPKERKDKQCKSVQHQEKPLVEYKLSDLLSHKVKFRYLFTCIKLCPRVSKMLGLSRHSPRKGNYAIS